MSNNLMYREKSQELEYLRTILNAEQKKIVDTVALYNRKAYNKAVALLEDNENLIDYHLLDNPSYTTTFVDALYHGLFKDKEDSTPVIGHTDNHNYYHIAIESSRDLFSKRDIFEIVSTYRSRFDFETFSLEINFKILFLLVENLLQL
jgi:hypothetical protein